MNLNKILPYNKHTVKSFFSFEFTPLNISMFLLSIGLVTAMFYGIGVYLIHGHHAYGVTRSHAWGLLLAMYVFFGNNIYCFLKMYYGFKNKRV